MTAPNHMAQLVGAAQRNSEEIKNSISLCHMDHTTNCENLKKPTYLNHNLFMSEARS